MIYNLVADKYKNETHFSTYNKFNDIRENNIYIYTA